MVNRPVNKKLVYLFLISVIASSFLFLTANALSLITMDARESFIISRITSAEEKVYSIELLQDNKTAVQEQVYQSFSVIESINLQLREYYASELVDARFYFEQQEKLVTLSTILLKTIQAEFSDRKIIYFFCDSGSSECDYEGFVLSYLSNKYKDKLFVIAFDASSSHPLIRMMLRKYYVESVPFLIVNGQTVRGLVNSKTLEGIINGEGVSSSS